jgi:undecaprenyl-diphosphatase
MLHVLRSRSIYRQPLWDDNMKLLNATHKYDVFLFSWLLHTRFHMGLARVSRYVSRTGDGELYVLTILLLYWHEGSSSIPLQSHIVCLCH